MEHGRASIEIWFMMTQWELDRTSACYVIIIIFHPYILLLRLALLSNELRHTGRKQR